MHYLHTVQPVRISSPTPALQGTKVQKAAAAAVAALAVVFLVNAAPAQAVTSETLDTSRICASNPTAKVGKNSLSRKGEGRESCREGVVSQGGERQTLPNCCFNPTMKVCQRPAK